MLVLVSFLFLLAIVKDVACRATTMTGYFGIVVVSRAVVGVVVVEC